MLKQRFINNFRTELTASIDDQQETIEIPQSDADRINDATPDEPYRLTLADVLGGQEVDWEVVRVIGVSGTTLTAIRDDEGHGARSWNEGTRIAGRLTRRTMNELVIGRVSPEIERGAAHTITFNSFTVPVTVNRFGMTSPGELLLSIEYREAGQTQWQVTIPVPVSDLGIDDIEVTGLDEATEYEYRAIAEDNLNPGIEVESDIQQVSTTLENVDDMVYSRHAIGDVLQIDPSDMTVVNSFTDQDGASGDLYKFAFGDGHLFFPYNTSDESAVNRIAKLNRNTMSVVDSVRPNTNPSSAGDDEIQGMHYTDGWLYAGDREGNLYKIDTSNMSVDDTLNLVSQSARTVSSITSQGGFLFVGHAALDSGEYEVSKIDLSTFSVVDTYHRDDSQSIVYDIAADSTHVYLGDSNRLRKIDHSDMTDDGDFDVQSSLPVQGVALDGAGSIFAVAFETVVKVDISDMAQEDSADLSATIGDIGSVVFGDGMVFVGDRSSGNGVIARLDPNDLSNIIDSHDRDNPVLSLFFV